MNRYNERVIMPDEMIEMFGERMPKEAKEILHNAPDHWTIGQVRAEVRRLGAEHQQKTREINRIKKTYRNIFADYKKAKTFGWLDTVRLKRIELDILKMQYPSILTKFSRCLEDEQ